MPPDVFDWGRDARCAGTWDVEAVRPKQFPVSVVKLRAGQAGFRKGSESRQPPVQGSVEAVRPKQSLRVATGAATTSHV